MRADSSSFSSGGMDGAAGGGSVLVDYVDIDGSCDGDDSVAVKGSQDKWYHWSAERSDDRFGRQALLIIRRGQTKEDVGLRSK